MKFDFFCGIIHEFMGVTWLRQEWSCQSGMSLWIQRIKSKLNLNANNVKFAPAYAKVA